MLYVERDLYTEERAPEASCRSEDPAKGTPNGGVGTRWAKFASLSLNPMHSRLSRTNGE